MGNKKINVIIISSIICTLILTLTITSYAFFQTVGMDNIKEEVNVQAGNLSLVFSDGNNGFSQALEFGRSAEKIFKIQNNGTLDAVAKINWKNITNNYLEGSLTYTLSYSETEDGNYTEIVKDENVPRSETPDTIELANGLSIPSGKTYYYNLTITLNYTDFDQTADLKASLSTEFSIEEGNNFLIEKLLAKANPVSVINYNTAEEKSEMFTFNHPEAEQITGWTEEERVDYRYIGAIPNNYINFNDETWRIIGVFTVVGENNKKEQRVKIIRNDTIKNGLQFNSNDINEWVNSTMANLLNVGSYYNRTGDYAANGLTEKAKNQIVTTKWYLGSTSQISQNGAEWYKLERGIEVYPGHNVNILQKVGLMYISDYLYTYSNEVNNACYNSSGCNSNSYLSLGWLHNKDFAEWFMIGSTDAQYNSILRGNYSGLGINRPNTIHEGVGTRPTVYLRSDIEIVDGDGSSSNPYILK